MLHSDTTHSNVAMQNAQLMVANNSKRAISWGMSLRERRFTLILVDFLLLNATLLLSLVLRGDTRLGLPILIERSYWFVTLGGLWFLVATAFGLYDLNFGAGSFRRHGFKVGAAALTVAIGYYLIPVLTPELPQRRIEFYFFPVLIVAVMLLWRGCFFFLSRNQLFSTRVLLVGSGASRQELLSLCQEINSLFKGNKTLGGYEILGLVDDQFQNEDAQAQVPLLGKLPDLEQIITRRQPREIVMVNGSSAEPNPETVQHLIACREKGYALTRLADFYEVLTQRAPGDHLGTQFIQMLPQDVSGARRLYKLFNRGMDLLIGIFGCLVTLMVMPFVWVMNRLTSPGPLFYSQERVGLAAKPYRIYKFRSMIVNAERDTGAVWAKENDTRITKFGNFLRRSRIDEFPQFWNVVKGEMSIIGPRPERPEFVEELSQKLPFYRLRHAIKPGITGWAQIKYPYGASLQDAKMKLQYDLYYIKHQGIALDMTIILRTISVILGLKGR